MFLPNYPCVRVEKSRELSSVGQALIDEYESGSPFPVVFMHGRFFESLVDEFYSEHGTIPYDSSGEFTRYEMNLETRERIEEGFKDALKLGIPELSPNQAECVTPIRTYMRSSTINEHADFDRGPVINITIAGKRYTSVLQTNGVVHRRALFPGCVSLIPAQYSGSSIATLEHEVQVTEGPGMMVNIEDEYPKLHHPTNY